MRRSEALAELELDPNASANDIKAAYRDLVKVWHPDRFAADDRMRHRAEARLQRINEAYRTLESGGTDPEQPPVPSPPPPSSAPPHVRTRAQRDAVLRGWVYLVIFVITLSFLGYAVFKYRQAAQAERDAAPSSGVSATPPASGLSPVDPIRSSASQRSSPARVTPLSEAQIEQLESACGAFAPASQQYADCAQSHLSAFAPSPQIHNRPAQQRVAARVVALDGLTTGEKLSVEHVCATAPDYNQCATAQVAKLATTPLRPDISRLSPRDRAAVERACASARDHDGPSAYDHCVVEFERMLASPGH